jgi:GntR family transcriptional regulator
MTVDHYDPTPLYVQLARIVRERIRSGEFDPMQVIPSETQLVQEHGVARETVRRAVDLLRREGWIFTLPQRGSYVSPREDWPTEGDE